MTSFNESKIEILSGAVECNSGPHPIKVHADEIELMPVDVFRQTDLDFKPFKLPTSAYTGRTAKGRARRS